MHKIQQVVNSLDILVLTEPLSNAIDLNIDTHEVFSEKDKFILKRYRGRALIVRKSLKHQFTEAYLRLWLKLQLDVIDYWFGLDYFPRERSRHWDVKNFAKIQNDVLNSKTFDSNMIL